MTTETADVAQDHAVEVDTDGPLPVVEPALPESEAAEEPRCGRGWLPGLTCRWEAAAYGSIFIVALVMRLWDLGSRAVHHDESLHGYFSWQLYAGQGYEHNPMMHGVFLFLSNAGAFHLFGDSEFAMRLVPALFGAALILVSLLLRNRLGNVGALVAAGMLAFSPALLYFSRFARNDIMMAVFTLGLVGVMWRYLDERKPRYLYAAAAIIALGFATKETMYITVAIVGAALLAMSWKDVGLWIWGRRSMKEWGPAAGFLLVLATLTLPLWGAASAIVQGPLSLTLAAKPGTEGAATGEPLGAGLALAIAISVVLLLVGMGLGIYWGRRVWLTAWAIAAAIFVVIMSVWFDHPAGVATGIWQSLGYWLAQQDVARGEQPWYYYFITVSVYEFLPWTIAVGAGVYYAVRGNAFTRFLVFWALATFVAYSLAGEKMPWLLVNVTLPLIILSAKALGDVISRIPWRRAMRYGIWLLLPGVFAFLLVLWRLIFTDFEGGAGAFGAMFGMLVFEGVLLVGLYELGRRIGRRAAFGGVLLALAVLMGLLTVKAGWVATYENSDMPVEMLVYTQSSPALHALAKEIDAIAALTGEREEMKITIDSHEAFTWPWAWYLRRYENVDYPDFGTGDPPKDPTAKVAVINSRNNEKVAASYAENYSEPRRLVHRWWFNEDYKELTTGDFFRTIINRNAWRGAVDYFLYRKRPEGIGGVDSYVYFRNDIPVRIAR